MKKDAKFSVVPPSGASPKLIPSSPDFFRIDSDVDPCGSDVSAVSSRLLVTLKCALKGWVLSERQKESDTFSGSVVWGLSLLDGRRSQPSGVPFLGRFC